MKSYLFNLFICFTINVIFIGCHKSVDNENSNRHTKDSLAIEIKFDYETNCLPFDSLFNDVFYVKLETTEKSLIGNISQILFTDDKIVVVDNEISKNISLFDISGKFINNIGNIGGGPKEYSRINYVALYPDNSMIVVNDNTTQLKYYNIDGTFTKGEKLVYRNNNVEFLNDKIIVSDWPSGNQINKKEYKPRFIVSNISGEIYYSDFESLYSKIFTYVTPCPIKKFGEIIFYNPSFSDTIYQVEMNGITPKYVFKMKGVNPLIIDKNMNDKTMKDYQNRYPFFNGEWFDLENSVFVNFMHHTNPWDRFALYSKKQEKSFCCSGSLFNPLFYLWHTPKARYKDNYLVSVANAADILLLKEDMYRLKQ